MTYFANIFTNEPCKTCGKDFAVILIQNHVPNEFCSYCKCRYCGSTYTTGSYNFSAYAGTVVERTIEYLGLISPIVVEIQDDDEERITEIPSRIIDG
jgi:ribosomal protein L37AE/L43A